MYNYIIILFKMLSMLFDTITLIINDFYVYVNNIYYIGVLSTSLLIISTSTTVGIFTKTDSNINNNFKKPVIKNVKNMDNITSKERPF